MGPASLAQTRVLMLAKRSEHPELFHLPAAWRLRGPLEATRLARAIDELMRRHEALRTRFVEDAGELRQRIDPPPPPPLVHVAAPAASDAELARLALEAWRKPFDLARGPLARFMLIAMGPEEHALVMTLHQAIADGWSFGVVLKDLTRAYGGEPLGDPAAHLHYLDFVSWQNRRLAAGGYDRQLEYWRQRQAAAPPPVPWTSHPAPPGGHAGRVDLELSPELVEQLTRSARRRGATCAMGLLAAFGLALARATGVERLAVGTPVANRIAPALRRVVGLIANTVAIDLDFAGRPAVAELLARVRQSSLGAYAHQEAPFELVGPSFNVMFLTVGPGEDAAFAGLEMEAIDVSVDVSTLDLVCTMWPRSGGGYGAELRFRQRALTRRRAEALAASFGELVASIASERDPWALPLFELEEAWRDTAESSVPAPSSHLGVEPRDRVEERLAELWSEVLGRTIRDVTANFFDVGGTSLAAVRMLGGVEQAFGRRLPLTILFACDTIEALADEIREHPLE